MLYRKHPLFSVADSTLEKQFEAENKGNLFNEENNVMFHQPFEVFKNNQHTCASSPVKSKRN